MTEPRPTIHASLVSVRGTGVLIRGEPGSGKSTLALALIGDIRRDCTLVADDRVILSEDPSGLYGSPADSLAGLIEIRGVGIVRMSCRRRCKVGLVVDLLRGTSMPRLPEASVSAHILATSLPLLGLPIGVDQGALRVRAALSQLPGQLHPLM